MPIDPTPKQRLTANAGWLQLRTALQRQIPNEIRAARVAIRHIRDSRRHR